MSDIKKQMKLAAFLYPTGYHVAAWRHPEVPADAGCNFKHFTELAKLAEIGKFDFIFLADSMAVQGTDWDTLSHSAIRYVAQFEPITLLSALASHTSRIGLVASATTTYNQPFDLARKLASLDHISGGRVGWNLVTSQNVHEAQNFGLAEHPEHGTRYAMAEEFATVVKGLWDSWEDGAFVRDKKSGVFFDQKKLHVLDHNGQYFSVKGPLNVPRSPQGQPVIVQAGSSEAGRRLAARIGEVIFTAQQTLEGAQRFYADVHGQIAEVEERHTKRALVMPGVFPFVGKTQAEAEHKRESLQELVDPIVGLSLLNGLMPGIDLRSFPLDGPLPAIPESNASKSRRQLLVDAAVRDNLSIRELYLRVAASRGHWQLAGTPDVIADALEEWFSEGAADGFNIMAPYLPGGLEDFVELVVPELQRRGLYRKHYSSDTLRGHLDLPIPTHSRA